MDNRLSQYDNELTLEITISNLNEAIAEQRKVIRGDIQGYGMRMTPFYASKIQQYTEEHTEYLKHFKIVDISKVNAEKYSWAVILLNRMARNTEVLKTVEAERI